MTTTAARPAPRTLERPDPVTGRPGRTVACADAAEVDAAVRAAREAYPGWRATDSLLVVAEHEDDLSMFTSGAPGGPPVTLHALDPATGAVRWSRKTGGQPACGDGSAGWFGPTATLAPTDRLVCVVPGEDGWSALVLDVDGEVVAERPLPGVDGLPGLTTMGEPPGATVVTPTSDGLLRLTRVGDPPAMPELADVSDTGEWRTASPVPARDLRVALEDPVTGQERWSTTVRAEPALDASSCVSWPGDGGVPQLLGDTSLQVYAAGGVVSVEGCGVTAVLTTDGVRLDGGSPRAQPAVAAGGGYAVPPPAEVLPGGGRSVDTSLPWTLVDRGGAPVGDLPGPPARPVAADDTDPGLLLADDGGALVALRTDDLSQVWAAGPGTSDGVLALVDGTIVILARGDLVGLDAATGRPRWTTDVDRATAEAITMGAAGFGTVFTDGRRVVVLTPAWSSPDGDAAWTAFDVASGEAVWSEPLAGEQQWTAAVGGHLVRGGLDRVEGLG